MADPYRTAPEPEPPQPIVTRVFDDADREWLRVETPRGPVHVRANRVVCIDACRGAVHVGLEGTQFMKLEGDDPATIDRIHAELLAALGL